MKKSTLKVLLFSLLALMFVGSITVSYVLNRTNEVLSAAGGVEDDPEPEFVYCAGGVETDPEPEFVYCAGGVETDPEPEFVYCTYNSIDLLAAFNL